MRHLRRRQWRVLDRLARAGERGRLLSTDEVAPGRALSTLRSLERRRYVRLVDATARPYLWRVTLAGLVVARAWRARQPDAGGDV